jgi:hypothetical protein
VPLSHSKLTTLSQSMSTAVVKRFFQDALDRASNLKNSFLINVLLVIGMVRL